MNILRDLTEYLTKNKTEIIMKVKAKMKKNEMKNIIQKKTMRKVFATLHENDVTPDELNNIIFADMYTILDNLCETNHSLKAVVKMIDECPDDADVCDYILDQAENLLNADEVIDNKFNEHMKYMFEATQAELQIRNRDVSPCDHNLIEEFKATFKRIIIQQLND